METGVDNKKTGEHDFQQASQLKEEEQERTNNSNLDEAHPSSPSQSRKPSSALESSQSKPSASETIPTNVESQTPAESGEDDVPNSSMPKHEHGDVVVRANNQGAEIQNPPVQVMERSGESGASPRYVFPSHVFSNSNANSTVEWSTASTESLFSIYMGNMSFSNELICFKSGELDKPGDVCMHDQTNASPTHQPDAQAENKFNDISKRTYELQLLHEKSSKAAEAKAAETMREVIMENSISKGDLIPAGGATPSNMRSTSNAHSHKSDGSTKSFAFNV